MEEIEPGKVYALFTMDYGQLADDESEDVIDETFEGVYSTIERAAKAISENFNNTLTPDKLQWQSCIHELTNRKHYRTQMVDGFRFEIRETVIDVGDWQDFVNARIKS